MDCFLVDAYISYVVNWNINEVGMSILQFIFLDYSKLIDWLSYGHLHES